MKLFSWITDSVRHCLSGHQTWFVDQVAGEVARQCRAGLWQRTCPGTETMNVSEIRGYVRAHAAGFVEREADQTLARRRIRRGLRSRVVASAVDQLIALVIRDVLSGQTPCDLKTKAA